MSVFDDSQKDFILENIMYCKDLYNTSKVELMTMLAEIIAYIGKITE